MAQITRRRPAASPQAGAAGARVVKLKRGGDERGEAEDIKLLNILKAQRHNSIGFDTDKDISADRERALDYYKGVQKGWVAKDLPVAPNRSAVVSTDVADGIETALPDLMEVFTGEDILTFQAMNEDDTDAAKQETDYTRYCIMQRGDGWRTTYMGFKDALLSKTGVFHYQWEGKAEWQEYNSQAYEGQLEELKQLNVEIVSMEDMGQDDPETGDKFLKVTCKRQTSAGHVAISVVPPEDFTVSPTTVLLAETNYCAARMRSTIQDLIEQGYDADKVRKLNRYESTRELRYSRDTVNENAETPSEDEDDLRVVEILIHYIRIDLEGTGKPQIWRIVTGNEETVELDREKRSRIEFAAITPFPMPHRFYGQSLADKLISIQAWMTSITRMTNDHAYFSNNQRQEVKFGGIIPGSTLEQLVNNEPGAPVVTQDGNSLKPIQNGTLGFDPLALLEYIATVGEKRGGIVRSAQGLNPDSLHETATGATILTGAAQKRVRMMARLFAETGLKDLYLGVHDLLRCNATVADTIELRGKWVTINPSTWSKRKDLIIDIGIGSGKDAEIDNFNKFMNIIDKVIAVENSPLGPPKGPIVTSENIYKLVDVAGDRLNIKGVDRFISNPNPPQMGPDGQPLPPGQQPPPGAPGAPGQQPPDPQAAAQADAQAKAQAEQQAAQAKAASDHAVAMQKAQSDAQLAAQKAQTDAQLAQQKIVSEHQLALQRAQQEGELAMQQAQAQMAVETYKAQQKAKNDQDRADFEARLANQKAQDDHNLAVATMKLKASLGQVGSAPTIPQDRPGGELDL